VNRTVYEINCKKIIPDPVSSKGGITPIENIKVLDFKQLKLLEKIPIQINRSITLFRRSNG
jgi:hypothetical protein